MNFFVVPREIWKINKRGGGGQNKLRSELQKSRKNKLPPRLFWT